jgi:hypothetical protein
MAGSEGFAAQDAEISDQASRERSTLATPQTMRERTLASLKCLSI